MLSLFTLPELQVQYDGAGGGLGVSVPARLRRVRDRPRVAECEERQEAGPQEVQGGSDNFQLKQLKHNFPNTNTFLTLLAMKSVEESYQNSLASVRERDQPDGQTQGGVGQGGRHHAQTGPPRGGGLLQDSSRYRIIRMRMMMIRTM